MSENKTPRGWDVRKLCKRAFIVLVAVFLAKYFYDHFDDYKNLDVRVNAGVIAAAVCIHFLYKVMQASLWHYITRLNDCAIGYFDAITAFFYSILGKYIPGKVFVLLARLEPYEKAGRSVVKVTVSFVLQNICSLLGAAFLFLLSLLFFPNDILAGYQWAAAGLSVAFFVCIHPRIINFFLGILQRITKKDNLLIPIRYADMVKVVCLFILNWLMLGVGFYLIICAIYPIPAGQMLYVSGVFGLSVIIGLLAVFAPSGIGVREGILVLGLSMIMPQEYAVIISLVSRVWMTFSELAVVLAAFVADKARAK